VGAEAVRDIVKKFAIAIKAEYNPQSVYIFGSFAKGNSGGDSDIDVAVIVEKVDGDFWEKWSDLFSYSWDIDSKIEPHLLLANSEHMLLDEIYKTGEKVLF